MKYCNLIFISFFSRKTTTGCSEIENGYGITEDLNAMHIEDWHGIMQDREK